MKRHEEFKKKKLEEEEKKKGERKDKSQTWEQQWQAKRMHEEAKNVFDIETPVVSKNISPPKLGKKKKEDFEEGYEKKQPKSPKIKPKIAITWPSNLKIIKLSIENVMLAGEV